MTFPEVERAEGAGPDADGAPPGAASAEEEVPQRKRGRPKKTLAEKTDAQGNRIVGKYSGSPRPDWIWPGQWSRLSPKQQAEAVAEDKERKQKAKSSGSAMAVHGHIQRLSLIHI